MLLRPADRQLPVLDWSAAALLLLSVVVSNLAVPVSAIVGGEPVTNVDDYPFHAHLGNKCGATVYHDDLIVTAQHCPFGAGTGVRFHNLKRSDAAVTRTVTQRAVHPDFASAIPGLHDLDVAVLKVDSSVLVDATGAATGVKAIALNTDVARTASFSSCVDCWVWFNFFKRSRGEQRVASCPSASPVE
jgi:hypothetical protein